MKRRDFLRASAVGGAAVLGPSVWTRRGNALPFGEIPSGNASSMLPENLRAENVLECFLAGGFTPWTSVYCVPGRGEASETFAYAQYGGMIDGAERCGIDDAAANPFTFFARDSAGLEIFFGPSMARLLARPDVLRRARLVVNRHEFNLHDTATPLMASGRTFGNPTGAALATHVNRYFTDRDVTGNHAPPFSYVMTGAGGGLVVNNLRTPFLAQGLHPGHARPLQVTLDAPARLNQLLSRAKLGTQAERANYDELLDLYFLQYSRRLEFGSNETVRAGAFQDLSRAVSKQKRADVIQGVLPASYLEPWKSTIDLCGTPSVPAIEANYPAMGLRLAAHLLTHPTYRARHCTVVDIGLRQADGGGGYDTHTEDPITQTRNLDNFLLHLLSFINGPGENDPGKLDLDKTMIILNTEFGRTPGRQGGPTAQGRNHWANGFAQIYIGGPIREAQAGIYGHIDDSGYATEFTTPAENRIAALLALGIYPFAAHGYSSGDVQGEAFEGPAARSVIRRILGHVV